jgi:hypothetical protein
MKVSYSLFASLATLGLCSVFAQIAAPPDNHHKPKDCDPTNGTFGEAKQGKVEEESPEVVYSRSNATGSGLGTTRRPPWNVSKNVEFKVIQQNGLYVGIVCKPIEHRLVSDTTIANLTTDPAKPWTPPAPRPDLISDSGDITLNTQDDVKTHELGHVSVEQEVCKIVSKFYSENVSTLASNAYAHAADAKKAISSMHQKFTLRCIGWANETATLGHQKHSGAVTVEYGNEGRKEWRDPGKNWYADQGVAAFLNAVPITIQLPPSE